MNISALTLMMRFKCKWYTVSLILVSPSFPLVSLLLFGKMMRKLHRGTQRESKISTQLSPAPKPDIHLPLGQDLHRLQKFRFRQLFEPTSV